jgi:hypothetical protein
MLVATSAILTGVQQMLNTTGALHPDGRERRLGDADRVGEGGHLELVVGGRGSGRWRR